MADSQASRVKRFIQTLEREDRYIVLLYYADGLTPVEISRVLDVPSTRVRCRLSELRAQLAAMTQGARVAAAATQPTLGDTPAAYA